LPRRSARHRAADATPATSAPPAYRITDARSVGPGNNFDFASADGFDSLADSGFNGGFDYASAVGDRVVALATGGEAAAPRQL
jgi:hypothetical protein